MAWPDDPRDLKVGFAFGHNDAEDPSGLTFETVSPNPDDEGDPGPVLGAVRITRGRIGDAPTTDATEIETGLRDTEGHYSRRNVQSPYFGQLRNGTPVQVAVDVGSGDVVLGTAFVPSWSPTWTGPDLDDRVAVNALGILAKIGRDREVKSALQRGYESVQPTAYWRLGDGPLADAAALTSGTGGPFLEIQGTSVLGVAKVSDAVGPGISLSRGAVTTIVSATAPAKPTSRIVLDVTFSWDALGQNFGIALASNALGEDPDPRWWLTVFDDGIVTYGNEAASGADTGNDFSGVHHLRLDVQQVGLDSVMVVYVDGVAVGSPYTDTNYLLDDNTYTHVVLTYDDSADPTVNSTIVVSDIALYVDTVPLLATDAASAAQGWAGEQAHDRLERTAGEVDVPMVITGTESTLMGPQLPDTLLGIWRDAEATDHGILYEQRDGRMAYKTRRSLYNLTPALELDYGTEEDPDADVSDLTMLDDDRDLYNVVTVTRRDGSSVTREQDTGPVGTDEIGPRPLPVTLNLASDDQLADHAGWLLRAGTINKPRFVLVLDLFNNPSLRATVLACDIGSRVTVSGAPAKHVGPDTLDLIVEGEVLDDDATRGLVAWWCEPYDLWDIGTYASSVATATKRYDTLGSTLADDVVAGTDTTFDVDIAAGHSLWTLTAGSWVGLQVEAGGVIWDVVSISGTSSPQTFTVTQTPANGVSKSVAAGTQIRVAPALRGHYGL